MQKNYTLIYNILCVNKSVGKSVETFKIFKIKFEILSRHLK